MKKKCLVLSLVLSMFLSSSVYAKASNNSIPINPIISSTTEIDMNVSPLFMYTYTKTVVKYHSDRYHIPETIDYSEYDSLYGWCYGTLTLQSIVKTSNGYDVTYTGTMYASVN